MRSLSPWVLGLGAVAIATSGCAGGSATPSATKAVVTKRASTPTRTPAAKAKPADLALAARGVLLKRDLPADWKLYKAGAGAKIAVRKRGRLGCSVPTALPGAYPWVAANDGGIYQKAKLPRFVSSYALVFKNEPAAKTYAATLRSPQYVECWRKSMSDDIARQKGSAPGSTFRVGPLGAGSGPLEGRLHFIYQARVGGKIIDANGIEDLFVYRQGRIVMLLPYETSFSKAELRDTNARGRTDADFGDAINRLLDRTHS
jgi:hypothetical protein